MIKFLGTGSSDGIAISKVLKLEESIFKINQEKIFDIDKELDLLKLSMNKTRKDLEVLRDLTLKKLGKDKAAIFEAHLEILDDPIMEEEIVNNLKNDKLNLAYCIKKALDKQYNIFSNLEDPYLKERAIDIKDIFERLLKYVLNIPVFDLATLDKEVIIVAKDLTPSQTAQINPKYIKGFVCDIGGRTSHAAIMARSLEIPAVLGLKNITTKTKANDLIIIDGNKGTVIVNPTNEDVKKFEELKINALKEKKELLKFKDKHSQTKDGIKVQIEANIGSLNDIDAANKVNVDGVGLFRSEFLYMDNTHFPTEEEQFVAYKTILEKMNNKIVIIRTLDIGGDKKLSYFTFSKELNPFLGYRAIRFCLDHKDVFITQIRALLRASIYGKLGIMFPMIATVEEFLKAKDILLKEKENLKKAGIKVANNIQIGMMVEIPAVAVNIEAFAKHSDFFSIGTNDLIQYSFAADRMSETISYLYQPYNPSLLKLVKMTIDGAHKYNRWVGMCGEVAGDLYAIPLLIGMGLDAFSMSATSVLKAKKLISEINSFDMKKLLKQALLKETNADVLKLVKKIIKY